MADNVIWTVLDERELISLHRTHEGALYARLIYMESNPTRKYIHVEAEELWD